MKFFVVLKTQPFIPVTFNTLPSIFKYHPWALTWRWHITAFLIPYLLFNLSCMLTILPRARCMSKIIRRSHLSGKTLSNRSFKLVISVQFHIGILSICFLISVFILLPKINRNRGCIEAVWCIRMNELEW